LRNCLRMIEEEYCYLLVGFRTNVDCTMDTV
jgi:hypothetical protein